MMMEWRHLQDILEHSLRKHGDKPITIAHLLAIIKMINRRVDEEDRYDELGIGPDDFLK